MNEERKSIWTKPRKMPSSVIGWLVVATGIAFLASLLALLLFDHWPWRQDWPLVIIGTVGGASIALLYFFLRWLGGWLFCWRNVKRLIFGLACAGTVIALFYAEEDWRGWHAWQQFKQQWEARGEKFDMAGVTPPAVPADQNFALAPIWVESVKATLGPERSRPWFGEPFAENGRTNFTDRLAMAITRTDNWKDEPTNGDWAKATITDLGPWQAYYREPARPSGKSATATNEFPISTQPQSPAADVLLALSRYDSAIEDLRLASQRPYSRFPLNYDYEPPSAILLPQLAMLKRCTQVLQLRATAELQNNQAEKALADVNLSLRLLAASGSEPTLISHLVRLAMLQILLQPVWEGCAQHQWSDFQLAALEAELAKIDFAADYALAMRGEMAFQNSETDWLRLHPEELRNISGEFQWADGQRNIELPGGLIARLIPAGWFYQNQLRCDRPRLEFFLPAAEVSQGTFSPDMIRRGNAAVAADVRLAGPYNLLEWLEQAWLDKPAKQFAYGQASVNLARTALALEIHRLARGEYPDSLDALAPQFNAAVPHDVIGGKPLKYRREPDGRFILYSIGWNETDDGGVRVFGNGTTPALDLSQGDWVWQYPKK